MALTKSICVYCGSAFGQSPRFAEVATDLGEEMARRGIRLIYGGGRVGLMGKLADAVMANGGQVTGIMPLSVLFAVAGYGLAIWSLAELGCRLGTAGPNRFGADPLTVAGSGQTA